MVNRVADLPLALILAARSDEPDELLTRIALHPSTTRARRRSRSRPPRSRELAGEERAAADPRGHAAAIPFYVHALLAAEDGDAARRWSTSIALRLDALPPRCRALARAIAVAGARRDDRRAARRARRARHRRGRRGAGDGRHPARRRLRPPARAAGRLRRDPGGRARRAARARPRGCVDRRRSGSPRRSWPPAPAAASGRREALRGRGRAPPGRAARPRPRRAYLRRAAEEQLPRAELVPLLRELARALIATEGPGGLPALREALALASDARARGDRARARPRADRPRATSATPPTVFAREARRARRATRARDGRVLDLALVRAARRPGRARARSSRPAPPPSGRGSRSPAARPRPPAPTTPRRRSRTPAPTVARRRAGRADGRRAARAGRRDLDRRGRLRPRRRRARDCCGSPSRCGRSCGCARGRVAEAEADLRELIALGRRARRAVRRLPDGAAVGDLAARRRAARARRGRRGAALGGADRPRARLAGVGEAGARGAGLSGRHRLSGPYSPSRSPGAGRRG